MNTSRLFLAIFVVYFLLIQPLAATSQINPSYSFNLPVDDTTLDDCLTNDDCDESYHCSNESLCAECSLWEDDDICCNGERGGDCGLEEETNCQDGTDNDDDYFVDCEDADCILNEECRCSARDDCWDNTYCFDGLCIPCDKNEDDWVCCQGEDLKSADCQSEDNVERICDDLRDNDFDGNKDCEDSDCKDNWQCFSYSTNEIYTISSSEPASSFFDDFNLGINSSFYIISNGTDLTINSYNGMVLVNGSFDHELELYPYVDIKTISNISDGDFLATVDINITDTGGSLVSAELYGGFVLSNTSGQYVTCEIDLNTTHYRLLIYNDSYGEAADKALLTNGTGLLSMGYNSETNNITCEFGGESISAYYPYIANEDHGLVITGGLSAIGTPDNIGGDVNITFDNLNYTLIPLECGANLASSTTLDSDLLGCGSYAINISSDNVTLDCNGYTIQGDGSYGIYVDANNFTLQNCNISFNGTSSNYAIYYTYDNKSNSNLFNNTIYAGNNTAIWVHNRLFNLTITDNHIEAADFNVLMISSTSSGVVLTNNTILGQGWIVSFGASNGVVTNNVMNASNGWYAFSLIGDNNTVANNNISATGQKTFYLEGSNNTVYDNRVQANGPALFSQSADPDQNTFLNNRFATSLNIGYLVSLYSFSHSNVLVYNNSFGEIRWSGEGLSLDTSDAATLDHGEGLNISQNFISFDSDTFTEVYDQIATISFYNLSYNETPVLLKDGARCDHTDSCNISYNNVTGILYANVSEFSNYTTTADVPCGIINSNFNLSYDLTSSETCFTINSSNVVLDCAGYTITGNGSGYGVNITNVDNVTIENCIVNNFSRGISKDGYDLNTYYTFQNNTINTYGESGYGLYLIVSQNSTIFNNTITTSGYQGSALYFNPGINYSNVSQNTLTTYANWSYGIFPALSYNNVIDSNTIVTYGNTSDGMDAPSSYGNTISNNNITIYGEAGGIDIVYNSSHNTISNNVITHSGDDSAALELCEYATNNTLSNNIVQITGTDSAGIDICDYAYNNTIINGILNATLFSDVILENGGNNNVFLNVSFNKSDVGFEGTSGSIIVRWYVQVNVTDELSSPISSVNVSGYNVTSQVEDSALTDANGQATLTLTEFTQNSSHTTYATPHSVIASLQGYADDSSSVNLTQTESTTVQLTLTNDCAVLNGDYTLVRDITTSGTCFHINASDITIDGAGYSLTGDGTGYGINNSGQFDNLIIRNFGNISNFKFPIYTYFMTDSVIYNNTIDIPAIGGGSGVYLKYSDNNNISLNNITTQSSSTGIEGPGADNNDIFYNTISTTGGTGYGIQFYTSSSSNTLFGNTISSSGVGTDAVRISGGSSYNISNNTLFSLNSTSMGLYLSASHSFVISNTINTTGNSADGINLVGVTNMTLTSNTIYTTGEGSGGYGIDLATVSDSHIAENNITTTGDNFGAITFSNSNSNVVELNTATTYGSESDSLLLVNADHNIVSENIITTYGYDANGVYISSGSTNCTLISNTINTQSQYGRGIQMASTPDYPSMTFFNNNITTEGYLAEGMWLYYAHYANVTSNRITTNGNSSIVLRYSLSNHTSSQNNILISNGNSSHCLTHSTSFNSTASNNIINTTGNSSHGTWSSNIESTNISYNNITTESALARGIMHDNSNDNWFTNNIIVTNGDDAIGITNSNCERDTISYNTVTTQGNDADGIYFVGSPNTTANNNNISITGESGNAMLIVTSQRANLSNNTASVERDSVFDVYLITSNNSQVIGNYFISDGNNSHPIVLERTHHSLISDNEIITYNLSSGIYLANLSSLNNITSNNITTYGDQGHGIYSNYNASQNRIENNYVDVSGNATTGITLLGFSNNYTIANNTLSYSGNEVFQGIYINASDNNIILSNLADYQPGTGKWAFYIYDVENTLVNGLVMPESVNITTNYLKRVAVDIESSPESHSSELRNLSTFLQILGVTDEAYIDFNLSYDGVDITSIDESSLRIYWYNGTDWAVLPNSSIDVENNVISSGNISLSSLEVFAPLGQSSSMCQTLNSDLLLDINLDTNGSCFTINSSNIVINGNGYTITGDGSGYGINNSAGFDNITIINFTGINNFSNGIYAEGMQNSTIYNNTIQSANGNNAHAIRLGDSSSFNNISSNTISLNGNTAHGVYLTGSSDSAYISSNTITDTSVNNEAIYIVASDNAIIEHNTITLSGGRAIELNGAVTNNTITNNNIEVSSGGYGIILLSGPYNNMVSYNNVTGSLVSHSIYLVNGDDNTIYHNIVDVASTGEPVMYLNVGSENNNISTNIITTSDVGSHGIRVENSDNNLFEYNNVTATQTSGYGFRLNNADNNTIFANNINGTSTSTNGIDISNSTNNKLYSNFINTLYYGAEGIYLDDGTNNTNISMNQIVTEGEDAYGIYIYRDSSNNYFNSNNITVLTSIGVMVRVDSDDNEFHSDTVNVVNNASFYIYQNAAGTTLDDVIINNGPNISSSSLDKISIGGVVAIPPDVDNLSNMSDYLTINSQGDGAHIDLNLSYTTVDVTNVSESSIRLYEYNGSNWTLVSTSGVDTLNNVVYSGEIINFSIFAPFGTSGAFNPTINNIECSVDNGTNWSTCSSVTYGGEITNLSINCTDPNGDVSYASFRVYNEYDDNNVLNQTNSTQSLGDRWIINTNFSFQDSGNMLIETICTDLQNNTDDYNTTWFVDWGTLQPYYVNSTGDLVYSLDGFNVTRSEFFNMTTGVLCVGGECPNVTAALDPMPVVKKIKAKVAGRSLRKAENLPKRFRENKKERKPGQIKIIHFKSIIQDEWKEELTSLGVVLYNYRPENSFVARITDIGSVTSLPYVESIGDLPKERKIVGAERKKARRQSYKASVNKRTRFSLGIFDEGDRDDVITNLNNNSIEILTVTDDKITFIASTQEVDSIVSLPEVEYVEDVIQYTIKNDLATDTMEIDQVGWLAYGLSGNNMTVAVADSGLDTGVDNFSVDDDIHRDFDNRATIYNWNCTVYGESCTDPDDKNGHGTHVSGSGAGDGNRSTNQYRGSAYESNIIFQAIGDDDGSRSVYPPPTLAELFSQAYNAGARIHTNSWGGGGNGYYYSDCTAVDAFLYDYPELLILFAAGNEGSGTNTIDAPGTSKNTLTVGASYNSRSGNIDTIASFSSRGQTDDGRVKPDVVAPGTAIYSTKSSQIDSATPACNTGGLGGSYYSSCQGTSMATPLVAGMATLTREYFQEWQDETNVSGVLVKAAIISGADETSYGFPSTATGWGRVNLTRTINPPPPAGFDYIDNKTGLTTGNTASYTFDVTDTSVPVKVTLVWMDYEASAGADPTLINDLNLLVQTPNASLYRGNDFDATPDDENDSINNVEIVRISDPETGTFTVNITGYNIPQGPQPYALIFYGGIRLAASDKFDDVLSTDLESLNNTAIQNVTNLTIGIANKGQINYGLQGVNVSGADLNKYITIDDNLISLDADNLPLLNTSARLSIFDLSYSWTPLIYKDGSVCSDCSDITYTNGNLSFNVTGFSNYTTSVSAQLAINDDTDDGITAYPNQEIYFYANYTNITDNSPINNSVGQCTITFESSPTHTMTYNAATGEYEYSRTFSSNTTYTYIISCNGTDYEPLSLSDDIIVQNSSESKGLISTTEGATPFWTNASSNPANSSEYSCLLNMRGGETCNQTWYVTPTGNVGTTWNFFSIYESTVNSSYVISNTSNTVNVTITLGSSVEAPTALFITNINDSALYLNWTNVVDADSYTVYYSTNVTQILNLNISNLGAAVTNVTGIPILNWTDTSSGSVTERYYRVAAIRSGDGNLTTDTIGKYDIEVVEATGIPGSGVDLNLISVPLIPNNYSINAILNQSSDNDLIYRYNTDTQNYQSTQFFEGFGWFGDFDEFEPGVGYAFKPVAASYNFTVLGIVPSSNLTVAIKNATGVPGSGIDLNLIGWHSPQTVCNISAIIDNASNSDIIYRYNTQSQNYQSTQFFDGFGWFGDFDCFEPGVAYEFKPVTRSYNLSYGLS